MPRESVGAEAGDSCGYIQGGKDCYMPQDIVGDEDGDSCGYNQGCKDCYMPQDGDTAAGTSKAVRTATCLRIS